MISCVHRHITVLHWYRLRSESTLFPRSGWTVNQENLHLSGTVPTAMTGSKRQSR